MVQRMGSIERRGADACANANQSQQNCKKARQFHPVNTLSTHEPLALRLPGGAHFLHIGRLNRACNLSRGR
jgi:hypothetical protein